MRATLHRAARFQFRKADTVSVSVTCKSLSSSRLAIFRVMVLVTLKTPKAMIFSNLQVAPRVSSLYLCSQKLHKCRLQAARRLSAYPFSSLSHVAVISSMISWQRDSGILMSVPALTRSVLVGRPLPITDVACSPR